MAKIMLLLSVLLVGCTTTQYIVKPTVVPESPPRPTLLIHTINKDTPPGSVGEAYKQSVQVLILYATQLEKIIEGMRGLGNAQEDSTATPTGTK